MTLRFIDSFDDRSTANAKFKYASSNGTNTLSTSYGRYAQGLFVSDDGNQWISWGADTGQQTWIMGFAIKSNLNYWNGSNFLLFRDGASNQAYVQIGTDSRIRVAGGGAFRLTSTKVLLPKTWNYFEIKIKIDNTTGSIALRINGEDAGSVSGIDTTDTANNYITEIRFQGGIQAYIDDLYICDGAGADDFRGDVRVETLLPNGAGSNTDWTPSAGNNYETVDDPYSSAPCPDGDTSYVSSTTTTNRDTYAYPSLVITTGTIHGVQVSPNARKTDAGGRSIKSEVYIGGTDYDGSSKAVADDYASYPELWVLNPADAAAWDFADVTGAEFGVLDFA